MPDPNIAPDVGGGNELPPSVLTQLRKVPEPDFDCIICQRHIDCRWNPTGARREIPPICLNCETVSHYDWAGRARYRAKPTGGKHLDRRNAMRIAALADEISAVAARLKWSGQHHA